MFRALSTGAVFLVLLAAMVEGPSHSQSRVQPDPLEHARMLHKRFPLIDGHNDLPWALREKFGRDLSRVDISKPQPEIMTDIPRLRAGGVGAQFWSVYVPADMPEAVRATMEEMDTVHRLVRLYPDALEMA